MVHYVLHFSSPYWCMMKITKSLTQIGIVQYFFPLPVYGKGVHKRIKSILHTDKGTLPRGLYPSPKPLFYHIATTPSMGPVFSLIPLVSCNTHNSLLHQELEEPNNIAQNYFAKAHMVRLRSTMLQTFKFNKQTMSRAKWWIGVQFSQEKRGSNIYI